MTIDTIEWKKFRVGDLFDIHPTKAYKLTNHDLFDDGDNPVVVNSAFNNGIGGYTTQPCTEKGNIVTFSDTTTADAIFYQKSAFVGYPHVQGMYPRGLYADKWNSNTLKFFTTVFHRAALSGTIDYVNKFTREIASQLFVKLPVTSAGAPDWSYMEEYMRGIQSRADATLDTLSAVCGADDAEKIETREWKKFRVGDLFDAKTGTYDFQPIDISDSGCPVITSGVGNNGIMGLSTVQAEQINANSITVDMFGNVIPRDFHYMMVTHARVFALLPRQSTTFLQRCFLSSILNNLLTMFNFKNMCSWRKIKDMGLSLPVTPSGTPDWDYMEEYMSRIEKRAEQALDTLSSIEQVAV